MNVLPYFPRQRYGIFTGTNSIQEWNEAIRSLLTFESSDVLDVIKEYENRFAKVVGVEHGVSFGAGRMALYAILEVMKIGQGDEVVIPAFTCVVVPNAIIYRGARPVYVDIDPQTFNIDVKQVEAVISPSTKALYAQHTFGIPCDLKALCEIGKRHGIPVIEDCGHALGSKYENKFVGSISDVAYFTTDHSKVINTHLGGMAVTNNYELAQRLKTIQEKTPFLDSSTNRRMLFSFIVEYFCFSPYFLWFGSFLHKIFAKIGLLFYFHDEMLTELPKKYPYPCRLSAQQAKIGLSQLDLLEKNIAHRRMIASWLEEKIGWYGFNKNEIDNFAWLRYSFLVKNRDEFIKRFSKHFDLAVWFTSVVGGRNSDFEAVGYKVGSCPVAEHVAQHIVNFPTHNRIPLNIIKREIEKNLDWIKRQRL